MDEIVDLLRKFVKVELEAWKMMFTDDDDDDAVDAKIDAANEFCAKGVRVHFGSVPPASRPEDRQKKAARVMERPVYLVKEFDGGKLYQAVLGENLTSKAGSGYQAVLFLEKQKGGPKIVSVMESCATCAGSGK